MDFFTLQSPQSGERAQRTFYYERPNQTVFACNEREASLIHKKYRQVGSSDGSTFFRLMAEARVRQNNALVALEMKFPPVEDQTVPQRKKWKAERLRISLQAKKDLNEAIRQAEAEALGRLVDPADTRGTFIGKFSSQMEGNIKRMIGL